MTIPRGTVPQEYFVPAVDGELTVTTVLLGNDGADAPAAGSLSAVIVLTGRLDSVEAAGLRLELARVRDLGARTLIIDLVGVRFIDSAGLAALVVARREAQSAGGDVVLVRPASPEALRVFRLTQFDEVFRLVDSRGGS
ncbi:MAG TPA: STAS domain-containing protein [Nakamurella sp.]